MSHILDTSFVAREVLVLFHLSNSPFCHVLVLSLSAFTKLFTKLFISDFVLKIKQMWLAGSVVQLIWALNAFH